MWLEILLLMLVAALAVLWFRHQRIVRELRESFHHDVRDLERAHSQAFAQQDARSHALVHSMIEGVLLLDADNRIVMANTAMRELFNVGNEAVGHSVLDSLRLHQVHDIVTRTLKEGRAIDEEIEVLRIDGASRFFQINSARIDNDKGDPQGVVLVFNEITRLERMEQTRREFVANVSHELRTPLSIIKGYAETLASMPLSQQDVAKYASIVERHADRLTLLVEDLLTISSLESDKMALHKQPVDVRRCVQQVMESLETKAEARSVILINDVVPDLQVQADIPRLQQVLTNLIDNAIKYGRDGGNVIVNGTANVGTAVISVSDDGYGIPPDARERVFERFYRLDKARSREEGGTGLGLAIVKHLVLAHGGRVWVEASVSNGAKFCFALPMHSDAVLDDSSTQDE